MTADSQLPCGHSFTPLAPGASGPTGYGILPDGSKACYSCCDEHQRSLMRTGTNRVIGYLSADTKTINTWTGGVLLSVSSIVVRKGRRGSGERWTRYYWKATGHGFRWFGVSQGGSMVTVCRFGKATK